MKILTLLSAGAVLAATPLIHAEDVRLEDCPAAVQATIRENVKGGRLDEIEFNRTRSLYVVDIRLTGGHDRELRVAGDGRLLLRNDDLSLQQLPKAVRRSVIRQTPADGRVDDIDRETTPRRVVYRVEIDRTAGRDLNLLLSKNGSVLRKGSRD